MFTSYDGQSITYDAIGNPTGYLGNTLTWQNGRELAAFTNSEYSISYSYDVNSLRTEKAVTQNGVTTNYQYFYNGSTLLQERIDNGTGTDTVLNFIYTADGKPYALEYSTNNGSNYTTYYYLTNLQGDVVSILDSNGAAVVTYSYDSWGRITQTTGTLANTLGKDNPLRYRGYVFDEETNLYYLQSRYYDPQTCRFINADGYASTGQGLLGTNCFAYCGNSPINSLDATGSSWIAVAILAIIAGLLTGCSSINDTINCYALAFGLGGSEDPGSYQAINSHDRNNTQMRVITLDNIIAGVERDARYTGKNIRLLNSPTDYDPNVEYLIACRITTTGEDYHFALLLDNGLWADKPGVDGTVRIGAIDGYSDVPWCTKYYCYDSPIIYFAELKTDNIYWGVLNE